jgi:hypothetical protein
MDLKTFSEAQRFFWRESLIKRRYNARIEIVQHQHHFLSFRLLIIQNPLYAPCPVYLGSAFECSAYRHPARGSVKRKMLQVPSRWYSLSPFSTLPGSAGMGSRTAPRNWYGFSSMHTTGLAGLYGREYTSNPSSIAAPNAAFGSGGMRRYAFR